MEGVELAARFGSVTNRLKYCGPNDFHKIFSDYLKDKSRANAIALQNAITKFEGHYPYLKLIANANGMDPFDYEVCEAYWLGNGLLENIPKEMMQAMILEDLTGKGKMNKYKAAKLAKYLPNGIVPHHSFHVYYVRFITGKVPWNIANADKCRVPFGIVRHIKDETYDMPTKIAQVEFEPIDMRRRKFIWKGYRKIEIPLKTDIADLGNELKPGDWIAMHWGSPIVKLSQMQKTSLEKYERMNIKAINNSI
ncbi:MAG: DUF6390 family protein [Candidatus Micrarchaeota archaeon]